MLTLTFVNNVFDNSPKPLTPKILDALFDASDTREFTERYRITGEERWKKKLPAIIVNGLYDHERAKAHVALNPEKHTLRNDPCFVASPFIGLDIDLRENPHELYQLALQRIQEKMNIDPLALIPLAYCSPGRGLRIVALRTAGLTIEQERQRWEALLELPCDATCKNLGRLYLLTTREDLLHYNPDLLFNLERHNPDDFPMQLEVPEVKTTSQCLHPADTNLQLPTVQHNFTEEQLCDIAQELQHIIGGGPAQKGRRNEMTYDIAKLMRHLTGDNPNLLERVIPQREESYSKHRSAIDNALRYGKVMPYLPADLKQAIERATSEHEPTSQCEPQQPPKLPEKLPQVMHTLLSTTPEKSQPAVAMAVFSALRALLLNVKFHYIDNTAQEPCFLNICIAEQASGKTALRPPTRAILHTIEEEDEESRRQDAEWRDQCATLSANAERPKRPTSPIRIVQADMTSPALVTLMRRAAGYSLYTYGEELEKLLRLQGASEIIRSAFDCEDYGQERVGANAVSDVVRLKWSIVYSTTPATAQRILAKEVNNGTLTRLALSTIQTDEDDWGEETPTYGMCTPDFLNSIDAFTCHLRQYPSETLVCEEALEWAKSEKQRQIDILKQMDAKYMLPFLWRSLQMAFWRACILYIMQGKQWTDDIATFASWTLDYDLWVKMHFFGQLIENVATTSKHSDYTPTNLLTQLPDTFTRDDARIMRRRMGKNSSSRALSNMLATWKKRGFITFDPQTNNYHKQMAG